jgi:hypothetical protein
MPDSIQPIDTLATFDDILDELVRLCRACARPYASLATPKAAVAGMRARLERLARELGV